MAAIVVPFRGAAGKSRLSPLPHATKEGLALAMLADVVTACVEVGATIVVTGDDEGAALARKIGAGVAADPGGGQGAAVAAALEAVDAKRILIVNADLPCVVPDDLRALERAIPDGGFALVAAADGTTNGLGLFSADLFAPLYGPGSADAFREHARKLGCDVNPAAIPNIADDVDTLADLERVELRVGPRTLAVLAPPSPKAAG